MMKNIILSAFLFCQLMTSRSADAQPLETIEAGRILLPNGWSLTPVGKRLPLGDLPLNMEVSPDGHWVAVTNNGQSTQTIELFNAATQSFSDSVVIPKSWMGLRFSADSKHLYVSGGNDNRILGYDCSNGHLMLKDSFQLGKSMKDDISPTGLEVDDARGLLYVVTKENGSLYVFNLKSHQLLQTIPLGTEAYTCRLTPDKKELWISGWGARKMIYFNAGKLLMAPAAHLFSFVPVDSHPNDFCFSADGRWLYVACANSNSVDVVDVKNKQLSQTLRCAMRPDEDNLEGSTTNSVTLSADGKTLYAANADNNCLAVFQVGMRSAATSKGFIPTGWYPTCVRMVGNDLWVSNGKGFSSFPDVYGPNPAMKKQAVHYHAADNSKPVNVQYIASLFRGTLSIIPAPEEAQLQIYTTAVVHNDPDFSKTARLAGISGYAAVPASLGESSPIKYVFYIVKENRTYDQVLGDMKEGNGDSSLVLFGNPVTPNEHALAKQFVLLDNFYVDGEVSADGHDWCLGAYATDYLEKTWPSAYGGRGGGNDSEGNRDIANGDAGFIWDICKKYGVTYRTYGEFADDGKANIPCLENHVCPYFTSWDQSVRDTSRFRQWKRDFDSLLSVGQVPQINTLRFINDHTVGLRKNGATPFAAVADNDLAVGEFVDYLSHSAIWNQSVVFITEDDAQNGPDHVDAHRTTTYVAGGWVKQGYVDHTMYSTTSILKTIELILGLPPMSQFDESATPMFRCFRDSGTLMHPSFQQLPEQVNLDDRNLAMNDRWQQKSNGFDFAKEDRAPEQELNEVIWVAVKGEQTPMPASVHAAFYFGK